MNFFLFFILLLIYQNLLFAQNFEQLIEKGDEFYNAQNYTEAAKYFSQAIQVGPKNVKGYWYRGDAYKENRNYPEAIKDYTKAIELEAKNWIFYKKRGDCYYNSNEFQLSEKDYSKALEFAETESVLWLYRGDCFAQLKQNEKACSDYQKAHSLGDKKAKSLAKNLGCEWIKQIPEDKPCPTGEAAISKVEIDPFTGAIFISKGLSFKDLEIKPEEGMGYITAGEFGLDESLVLKVLNPQNFCEDAEGDVLFGTGFSLYDSVGKELGKAEDIYANNNKGAPAEYLKSLSITLSFSKPMEIGKNYTVKVRFFDKRGNGEILVEMPFKLIAKAPISTNILSSQSTLGTGIYSKSVDTEIKSLEFRASDGKKLIQSSDLLMQQTYQIYLNEISNLPSNATYYLRFINEKGLILGEQKGKVLSKANKAWLNISTHNLKNGDYTIWLKIQGDKQEKNIGITIPVQIK